ncbi:hypothetical protein VKT23_009381 [Stygiomarasmius scandens]|uniref:Uncharacterized protein n=1 Tax=Marasmiellus scandens TaxID=2682957 RepID=A0ABR1JKJ7_9AGAR
MGWTILNDIKSEQTQLLEITQSVYQARALIPPQVLDHCHCPQIAYLTESPNDNTPKKCIIKLLQGEPNQPEQSCRFTIDLDNFRITDDWIRTNETFAAPQDIHWLLHEIRIYTVERYQQKKKDEERKAFRQKILDNGLMSQNDLEAVQESISPDVVTLFFVPMMDALSSSSMNQEVATAIPLRSIVNPALAPKMTHAYCRAHPTIVDDGRAKMTGNGAQVDLSMLSCPRPCLQTSPQPRKPRVNP